MEPPQQARSRSVWFSYQWPRVSWEWSWPGAVLLVLGSLIVGGGCVERRMLIRTDPPGAMVYVDDYELGTTPISTNFTYYGTRKIRLVKDGFKTKTIMQPVPPPWYQIPPLDFVSETLVPRRIEDHRTLSYQLEPEVVVPTDQLLGRAEALRAQGRNPGAIQPASFSAQSTPPALSPPPGPSPFPASGPVPAPGSGPSGVPPVPGATGPSLSPAAPGSVPMHQLAPGVQ